jgi:5-methylcytosine-specific restriction protein A
MPNRVPTARVPWASPPGRTDRDRLYDKTRRDKQADRFYHSAAWLKLSKLKLTITPWCEPCKREKRYSPATIAHHVVPISEDPGRALDLDNLESVCRSCHSRHHASEPRKEKQEQCMQSTTVNMHAGEYA